jgi:hypothetical protein
MTDQVIAPPDPDPDDRPPEPFDVCFDSKYGTHSFSLVGADGVTRCAFCGRSFFECLRVK